MDLAGSEQRIDSEKHSRSSPALIVASTATGTAVTVAAYCGLRDRNLAQPSPVIDPDLHPKQALSEAVRRDQLLSYGIKRVHPIYFSW